MNLQKKLLTMANMLDAMETEIEELKKENGRLESKIGSLATAAERAINAAQDNTMKCPACGSGANPSIGVCSLECWETQYSE